MVIRKVAQGVKVKRKIRCCCRSFLSSCMIVIMLLMIEKDYKTQGVVSEDARVAEEVAAVSAHS